MGKTRLDLQTIVMAAAEIVNTRGIDELTLAILSQKLGVRPPSLYNHVNGLAGLRYELVLYGYRQLKDVFIQASIGKSKDEAFRAIASAYRQYALAHPGVYEATYRYQDLTDPAMQQAARKVVDIGIKVLEPYSLRDDLAIHTLRGFRSLIHGFVSIEQQGGFGIPLDLDDSFHHIIETFLAGIRTP